MPHAPFILSTLIGPEQLKEHSVSALLLHGDRILIGTQTGTLLVYDLTSGQTGYGPSSSTGIPTASFVSKHETFTKGSKSIDQLGAIKELNALVCLSGGDVTFHSLPDLSLLPFAPPTKSVASLFATRTSVHLSSSTSIHTTLAVAARRKLLLSYWKDGQHTRSEELALPHQIRGMAFVDGDGGEEGRKIVAGFSTGDYGVITLPSFSSNAAPATLGEPFVPHLPTSQNLPSLSSAPSTSNAPPETVSKAIGLGSLAKATGLGALANLGLGSNKVEKNGVVGVPGWDERSKGKGKRVEVANLDKEWIWANEWDDEELLDAKGKKTKFGSEGEVLVVRENLAIPLHPSGKLRDVKAGYPTTILYPSPVDETLVLPPYVLSLVPPSSGTPPTSSLQVHSIDSLASVQSLSIPPRPKSPPTLPTTTSATSSASEAATTSRLLTANSTTPPFLIASSSTTTGSAAVEQKVWVGTMRSWDHQVEEMGGKGEWESAIRLLRRAGQAAVSELSGKTLRRLGILHALHLFRTHRYDQAIDLFIAFDLSPAKVIALCPLAISGKLCLDKLDTEEWFGGRSSEKVRQDVEQALDVEPGSAGEESGVDNKGHHLKGWRREHAAKPEETAARSAREKDQATKLEKLQFTQSVDVLIRYLTDRRQKYAQALSALLPSSRPSPSLIRPKITRDELLELPDLPLTDLKPEQLARVAQVVDTALFKSYLATKPVMVGPLCRIENWCEVEEVEELLLAAKKFRELLDLYNGKNMHEKAVKLLRQMSEDEDEDEEEKVGPTVRYLQKLGAEHVNLIYDSSEWVFKVNRKAGLQIFVADLEEVETLPRHATMAHLERIGPDVCSAYLEHIIHDLSETGADFHEKLIELYLAKVSSSTTGDEAYKSLLALLESSTSYRADRVLGRLPSDDMYQARAILLGRLGRHEGALQIYVYQLEDHATAEEYCKRVYASEPTMQSSIFHLLLRIYLRPRPNHPLLFGPALALISAHASSIDAVEVFDLLPPLVALSDIRVFLEKTLRKSGERFREGKILKGIGRSWVEEGEREVVNLEERRVKITESRVCPHCHKRLGNSVIAIHSPRGQVTHYQCREDFQASLHRGET